MCFDIFCIINSFRDMYHESNSKIFIPFEILQEIINTIIRTSLKSRYKDIAI